MFGGRSSVDMNGNNIGNSMFRGSGGVNGSSNSNNSGSSSMFGAGGNNGYNGYNNNNNSNNNRYVASQQQQNNLSPSFGGMPINNSNEGRGNTDTFTTFQP
jgi:hypothetical protein